MEKSAHWYVIFPEWCYFFRNYLNNFHTHTRTPGPSLTDEMLQSCWICLSSAPLAELKLLQSRWLIWKVWLADGSTTDWWRGVSTWAHRLLRATSTTDVYHVGLRTWRKKTNNHHHHQLLFMIYYLLCIKCSVWANKQHLRFTLEPRPHLNAKFGGSRTCSRNRTWPPTCSRRIVHHVHLIAPDGLRLALGRYWCPC